MRFAKGLFAASLLAAGWSAQYAAAQTPGALADIQKQMSSEFKLTKTTADRNDIVTAGSVLVLQKDGMQMRALSALYPVPNTFKDGRIQISGKILLTDMMTPDAAHQPVRKFVSGEKVWVINVAVQADGVVFTLYSDPFDDIRYFGDLKVSFNKKAVPSVTDIDKTIAEVLTVDASQAQASVQAPAPAPQTPAAAPKQPAMTDLPPPPPPPADQAAPPPKTISVGQTKDLVIATWGQPQKDLKGSTKEILVYTDMRVTIVGGKVTDVAEVK